MTLPTVVCDASVALKWVHEAGEEEVGPARDLLVAYADRRLDLVVLDLTVYEIGNVLVRALNLGASETERVLTALDDLCPRVSPSMEDLALAATLARDHGLTFYDATHAAVAITRNGQLATMDKPLLAARLGHRPSDIDI